VDSKLQEAAVQALDQSEAIRLVKELVNIPSPESARAIFMTTCAKQASRPRAGDRGRARQCDWCRPWRGRWTNAHVKRPFAYLLHGR